MKPLRHWWREYNVEIAGSIVIHLGLLGLLGMSKGCLPEIQAPKPVTKISVVSMGSVKKSKVPDRATRAPSPPKPKSTESSSSVSKPAPPTPPKPSEMTVPTEKEPPKDKEKPKEKPKEKTTEPPKNEAQPPKEKNGNSQEREELIRKTQREQLLQSLLNAPVGTENREETSQEGSEETTPGMPSATPSDPILSGYIQAARAKILPNWAPLPTLIAEHPEYEVIIQVEVLADGRLQNPKVVKKSGDASFDKAAIRAIYKTASLPPPPEKWKASAAQGILITLAAADKT
jgi:protein TonB